MTLAAPDFLVAGAPRSGTTALVRYLEQHPELAVTSPKEPHYLALCRSGLSFTGPGDAETINRLSVGNLADYRSLLEKARKDAAVVGDGSVTSMYFWPEVERTLREEFKGEPRVIVMLREPADRAYSSYLYQRKRGFEEAASFQVGLDLEESRIAAGYQHMWHYASCSHYRLQLQRILEDVSRERLLVVIFEEFRNEPSSVLTEIVDFLGVGRHRFDAVSEVNRSGEPKNFRFASAISRLRSNRAAAAAVRLVVPAGLRHGLLRRQLDYPDMPLELRRSLRARFAEDRCYVEELLGRPIVGWQR